MSRRLSSALLGLALIVGGCGGGDRGASTPRDRAPARLLTPQRADCAADRLATRRRPDDGVPRAGSYRYRVSGTRRIAGEPPKPLRSDMIVEVTPALRIGTLRCYRVRRTLLKGVSETATLVVRGHRLYLTEGESIFGGQRTHSRPDPPVLVLDPDVTTLSGSFVGPTSGRYKAEYIGRRYFHIAGRRVRAGGGRLTLASTGEQVGTQRSTQWLDPRSKLVVLEVVKQHRTFGVDELFLDYRAQPRRLTPEP